MNQILTVDKQNNCSWSRFRQQASSSPNVQQQQLQQYNSTSTATTAAAAAAAARKTTTTIADIPADYHHQNNNSNKKKRSVRYIIMSSSICAMILLGLYTIAHLRRCDANCVHDSMCHKLAVRLRRTPVEPQENQSHSRYERLLDIDELDVFYDQVIYHFMQKEYLPEIALSSNTIRIESNDGHSNNRYRSLNSKYVTIKDFFQTSGNTRNHTVTIATHATVLDLHYLLDLVPQWNAPISVSIWAPGSDLYTAIAIITQMRCCNAQIRSLVSFTFIIPISHHPAALPHVEIFSLLSSCDYSALDDTSLFSYAAVHKVSYPSNTLLNIARKAINTTWVIPMNIDQIPNVDLSMAFKQFMDTSHGMIRAGHRMVYVLPSFNIAYDIDIPKYKHDLISAMINEKAKPTQAAECKPTKEEHCRDIPNMAGWLARMPGGNSSALGTIQPTKWRNNWAPIFIAENKLLPNYNEEFVGGHEAKLHHAYHMCLEDYEYHILDNAFVMRYGIDGDNRELEKVTGNMATMNKETLKQLMNFGRGKKTEIGTKCRQLFTYGEHEKNIKILN